MNIRADDIVHGEVDQVAPGQTLIRQPAYRVEQKRAGAAGRVEQTLRRAIVDLLERQLRQPIGRVVFAQVVPRVRVDQILIKLFQQILADGAEVVDLQLGGQPVEQVDRFSPNIGHHQPGEEVVLADIADAVFVKGFAIDDAGEFAVVRAAFKGGKYQQLGELRQIGVAYEQVVVGDIGTIYLAQQGLPLSAPDIQFLVILDFAQQSCQRLLNELEGGAADAKTLHDIVRRRFNVLAAEKVGIKPQVGDLKVRACDIELIDLFDILRVVQHVCAKIDAVRQHADIAMKFWHVAHIIGELVDVGAEVRIDVALEFDD